MIGDNLNDLSDQINPQVDQKVAFANGIVVEQVDDSHLRVDLGDRAPIVKVPESLAGVAGDGAFVSVAVQGNQAILNSVIRGATGGWVPTGGSIDWYTEDIPAGYLVCNGQEFDPNVHPALFAVLGVNKVPDRRGRVGVAKNTGTFNQLGKTGGTEKETLTVEQMPTHQHDYGDSRLESRASTGTLPVHGTAYSYGSYSTSYSGGGQSHNNLPPYFVHYVLIKT